MPKRHGGKIDLPFRRRRRLETPVTKRSRRMKMVKTMGKKMMATIEITQLRWWLKLKLNNRGKVFRIVDA